MPLRAATGSSDLPRGLLLALAVIVLPLLAVITLQVYEAVNRSPRLERDSALVVRTFQVIDAADLLKSTAQNAERAERGYLLTGASSFRETYRTLANNCLSILAQLRQVASDTPEQRRRLPVLESAVREWLAGLQVTVDVHDKNGLAAAQQLIESHAGEDTLSNLDAVISATVAAERDLLSERESRAIRDESQIRDAALATSIVAVILLALGVWMTIAVFRRARRFEARRRETEQHLSEQLFQAQAALAQTQKMEALGQLTGGVAHDFNNLLHVIANAATIVQQRLRADDAEASRYLEMVKRNTDRAASTTARLLAFARQQPLEPKPTDLNRLVAGMAELLRSTLGESVAMEAVLGSGLWSVAVDRNQLETAILNLAINARDAMPHGGKLTIETSNSFLDESYAHMYAEVKAGQYALVALSDTGAGMPGDVASRAFEPFFTTKESGRGTGLGLSQVFGFVKQSSGHVKIYSEPGQGTTVKMYFPRLAGAADERPAREILPAAGSGECILLVEDNEDVRRFTAQMLSQLGYRVTVAPDGQLALRVLEQLRGVDLLFTDIGLPGGMTGRQLAEQAQRRWPSVKILYTTGYARNSIIHHGRLDAGVELIVKPFTQSALAAKVRRVLDQDLGTAA
jgi:signal transduction histidine kinase